MRRARGVMACRVSENPCLERVAPTADRGDAETGYAATRPGASRTCSVFRVGTRSAVLTGMSLRERAWEVLVAVLSWIVALVALACVAIYVAVDAVKRHRAARSERNISSPLPSASIQMELAA